MTGFLVCKVTTTEVVVVLNGEQKAIPREFKEAAEIIILTKEYNNTPDVEKRAEIAAKVEELLTPKSRLAVQKSQDFEFDNAKRLYLKGTKEPIPQKLADKILQFIEQNLPLEALANFWRHLLLNPDPNVRDQAFGFIAHRDIAITDKGYLVCAKAVQVKRKYDTETGEEIVVKQYDENTGGLIKEEYTQDMEFTPYHDGKYGMEIKIGVPVTMPREQCNPNPHETCSSGLHVGAIEYVADFGRQDGVILECLVSPRNIVSIPVKFAA